MKNKTPDPLQVWEQLEDVLVPRLRLSPIDRAVYARLVRHSRLQGQLRLQFSILQLARDLGLSGDPVRQAVRRLVQLGALRLIERSKAGHVVEVLLPLEIPAIRAERASSLSPPSQGFPSISSAPISCRTGPCARPSTRVSEAIAFTVCAASPPLWCASTMSSLVSTPASIPTATSFPAAWNATPTKPRSPLRIFCACYIAKAA